MFDQLKPVSSVWRLTRGCVIDGQGKKCTKLISFSTSGLSEDFFTAFFEQQQTPLILGRVFRITKNRRVLPNKENVSSVADSTAALLLT